MYTEKVLEHFQNPRNIGIIDDPTVLVQVGEPSCGDALLLTLKIENDHIVDIKVKVFGCGAAIATSSIATEMTMGKSLDEAVQITEQTIADALGGLPPEKMHCSNMAAGAIRGAINEYRKAMAAKAESSSRQAQ